MLVSRPQLTDQQATSCEEHQLFTNNVMIFRWHSLAEEGFHRNTASYCEHKYKTLCCCKIVLSGPIFSSNFIYSSSKVLWGISIHPSIHNVSNGVRASPLDEGKLAKKGLKNRLEHNHGRTGATPQAHSQMFCFVEQTGYRKEYQAKNTDTIRQRLVHFNIFNFHLHAT